LASRRLRARLPLQPRFSPAEQGIANAKKAIATKPEQFAGYNQLAIALSRRARETSDVAYYAQAEEALKKAAELAPDNFESAKIHVWLLLGRHEFPAALEAATLLNKRVPDDILVYGFLVDANAELGNYPDAENAAQWMLNFASRKSSRHDPRRIFARTVRRRGRSVTN